MLSPLTLLPHRRGRVGEREGSGEEERRGNLILPLWPKNMKEDNLTKTHVDRSSSFFFAFLGETNYVHSFNIYIRHFVSYTWCHTCLWPALESLTSTHTHKHTELPITVQLGQWPRLEKNCFSSLSGIFQWPTFFQEFSVFSHVCRQTDRQTDKNLTVCEPGSHGLLIFWVLDSAHSDSDYEEICCNGF